MDIYEPQEDSYLLQKQVKEYALGRVLDIGTGSSIQALTAAENKRVREVVAVDINVDAIRQLKSKKVRKINAVVSDLFEKVEGKFDTIIFNPPYLPQDKIAGAKIEDTALYGGKKGWEISARFFAQVSSFLAAQGKVLFLFSSYTHKDKIDEILAHHLLNYQILVQQREAMFEELYVYLITKSRLLLELERQGFQKVAFLAKGKRGLVYSAQFSPKSARSVVPLKAQAVAIKIPNSRSEALGSITNEARWLQRLNKYNVGPKFILSGDDYVAMELINGERFDRWLKTQSSDTTRKVILNVLQQCYQMDKLKVNKEEMHHPYKHIIVENNEPVMIDFERCKETDNPHNVSQFIEFLCRIHVELDEKKLHWKVPQLRNLGKEYKSSGDISLVISYLSSWLIRLD